MPTYRARTSVIGAVVAVCAATLAFGQPAASQAPSQQPSSSQSPAVAPPSPPSLSDLAKEEAARRQGLKAKKVYSDKDLKPETHPPEAESATPPEAAAAGEAPAPAPGAAPSADAAKEPAKTESKPEEHGEQYWRTRMTDAQEALRRNQTFLEALQSQINGLSADFAARDDPYQRAQIGDERQKALAELDRLTKEIDQNKKAIADIADEARRAGVPAGWLR
jgi:hypothetical protein